MQFRRLRYFVCIVEAGSFSRAAAAIHITQPALSQQIAELEFEVGVPLLMRSVRGVCPTRAGDVLYREAVAILRQIDNLPSLARSADGVIDGTVGLGLTSTLSSNLAVPLMDACRVALPKVRLRLTTSDSVLLRSRIDAGSLDLAVLFEDEPIPGYIRWTLFRQRCYLIRRAPFSDGGRSVSLEAVAGLPLILPVAPNVLRTRFERLFAVAGMVPNVVAEVDTLSSMLAAVKAGIGDTLLPKGDLSAVPGFEQLVAIPIEPPAFLLVTLLAASQRPLTAAGEAVRTLIGSTILRDVHTCRPPGLELAEPEG